MKRFSLIKLWEKILDFINNNGRSIAEVIIDVSNNNYDPKVHAVHFGVNHYDSSPNGYGRKIQPLQSCNLDALAMQRLFNDVGMTFIDEQATRERFVSEISKLASVSKAGDYVIITQSSHGTFYKDESLDEIDGRDEGTCTYNAIIWDDNIKHLISKFKKGVNVLSIWDTCHSGTATRSFFDDYSNEFLKKDAGFSQDELKSFWSKKDVQGFDGDIKCNYLHIGASQDSEYSLDGAKNGNFTGTLLSVIKRRKETGLSMVLNDILTEVKGVIKHQRPNIDIVTEGGASLLEMNLPYNE